MTLTESREKNAMYEHTGTKIKKKGPYRFLSSTGLSQVTLTYMIVCNFQCIFRPKHCVYIRAAVGLIGRDVAEALSRGSDEGSRKLAAGCFLTT